MIKLLSYILRLMIVLSLIFWVIASWRYEKPANIAETKKSTIGLFSSAKSAALEVAKKEIDKEI